MEKTDKNQITGFLDLELTPADDAEMRHWLGVTLDGRYEIRSLIGAGGMAYVYKAFDNRLQRAVAVKIIRKEAALDETVRARFAAESHAVAMLSHPNIVAIYDVSRSSTGEYIVMELIDGVTLLRYMEKKGALPWNESLHFARQIARALSHAHSRGIVHRDIKPQNIMLLRDGTVKVADFGIAALENEIQESDGEAVGSIHYIAPEQARGGPPDPRSDLYSLGVVMFEMFTGRKPYLGDSIREIAVKHMNADPPSMTALVPTLPPELERITKKAMCADLSQRYRTADELVADIDSFLRDREDLNADSEREEEEAVPVLPDPDELRQNRELRRSRSRRAGRVTWAGGSFLLIAVFLALAVFLMNFFVDDLFAPATRVTVPEFVGQNYDTIRLNPENDLFDFTVLYMVDTGSAPGTVLSQTPKSGRSIMVTPGGVDVRLTVATGDTVTTVPDVTNLDYRAATAVLRQYGLYIEVHNSYSSTVERDRVVRTDPDPGLEVTTASLIYVYVSCGEELRYLSVPNLVGLSEEAAISQIESNGFSYGWSQRERSDLTAGTVIGQSLQAFSAAEEHSMIYLSVSTGP